MNIITRRGLIFKLENYSPIWKVKITRHSGITDVISMDDIIKMNSTQSICVEGTGGFELQLNDNGKKYGGVYQGDEEIEIYSDMTDASTMIFKGYIDKIESMFDDSYGVTLRLSGSHISSDWLSIYVTESFENIALSTILTTLISTYAPSFTTTNIQTCETLGNFNWVDKPLWDCFIDICNAAQMDGRIDNLKDVHFFPKDSILNTSEAIVFGQNLKKLTGLGQDLSLIKNKVKIVGQDDEGIPIIYTVSNPATRTKEHIIPISDANSMEEIKLRAESMLNLSSVIDPKGESNSLLLPNLNAGEQIWISCMPHKIHGIYSISSFTHTWNIKGETETKCSVRKPTASISRLIKDTISSVKDSTKGINTMNMDYSYNLTFNNSTDLLGSGLVINDGMVYLSDGTTSTTGISPIRTFSILKKLSYAVLKVTGENYIDCTFYYTTNGKNWTEIEANSSTPVTVTTSGNRIGIKVKLLSTTTNPNPKLKSVALFFK